MRRSRALVALLCVLHAAPLLGAGCRTLESAKQQKGRGDAVVFEASLPHVFAAARQTVQALRLTIVGQNEQEGYLWAQQRPEPLRSWERLIPTPRTLRRGLQQAATPGQNVAVYFYPVDRERVIVEIVDQRVSPVGMDRLLTTDIFTGIQQRLPVPLPAPAAE